MRLKVALYVTAVGGLATAALVAVIAGIGDKALPGGWRGVIIGAAPSENSKQPQPDRLADGDSLYATGDELDELDCLTGDLDDVLESEVTETVTTARDSGIFVRSKAGFWEKATDEQKTKGKEILDRLRAAMDFPGEIQMRAVVKTKSGRKRDYSADVSFKYPGYYREDGQGDVSYTYITDGVSEIADFVTKERKILPGVVGRDVDSEVYFDMFPARIVVDSEVIWSGGKSLTSTDNHAVDVNVLSGWSYDILVRNSDSLVEQMLYYDRQTRSHELIRVYDIEYGAHMVRDPATNEMRRRTLPVRYTVTYGGGAESATYDVTLDYKFEQSFSDDRFRLALDE